MPLPGFVTNMYSLARSSCRSCATWCAWWEIPMICGFWPWSGIQTIRLKPSWGTGWCAPSWFSCLLLGWRSQLCQAGLVLGCSRVLPAKVDLFEVDAKKWRLKIHTSLQNNQSTSFVQVLLRFKLPWLIGWEKAPPCGWHFMGKSW